MPAAPPVSTAALSYAVNAASPAERAAFANVLGTGWRERHATFDGAGIAEAVELMNGGRNGRFNSNETRIRNAGLALMGRYPFADPFAPQMTPEGPATVPPAPGSPPPGASAAGSLVAQLGGPYAVALGALALLLLLRKG